MAQAAAGLCGGVQFPQLVTALLYGTAHHAIDRSHDAHAQRMATYTPRRRARTALVPQIRAPASAIRAQRRALVSRDSRLRPASSCSSRITSHSTCCRSSHSVRHSGTGCRS